MKRSIQKIIVWPLCLFLFIGVVIIGNFDTICIGNNGHIEFETECLPCCDKSTDICKLETENDFHEHDSCHDCSDLSMDGPLWSKRITKKGLLHSDKLLSVPTIHNNVVHTSLNNISLQNNNSLLTFYKAPQSISIAATILRC